MYRSGIIATIENPYPNNPKLVCVQLVKGMEEHISYNENTYFWVRLDLVQYYDVGEPLLREIPYCLYGDKFYNKEEALEQYLKMDASDIETMGKFHDMIIILEG